MSEEKRIVTESDVLSGKPIIRGTRMSVEFVVELLSSGMSVDEILEEYPHLEEEDIRAALRYAVQALRHEEVYPIEQVA